MKSTFNKLLVVLFLTVCSATANAAYCALRDPVVTLSELFPDATSHKSIVKVVGEEQRIAVSEQLPPNVLHFSELGQHTLYVTYKGNEPLGYVHVRSEESEWGLVEIAWALDLDLKVVDYRFQRCRSRARRALETDAFKAQLLGMDVVRMKQLLAADQRNVDLAKMQVPAGAEELAGVLLRCGLKTLLVTQMVWSEDIARLNEKARIIDTFENASASFETKHLALESQPLIDRLGRAFPDDTILMDPSAGQVVGVYDNTGKVLGTVYRNQANLGGNAAQLEWHISSDSKVLDVLNLAGWSDARTEAAFVSAIGQHFRANRECSDRPALLTKQAVVTAQLALDLAGS